MSIDKTYMAMSKPYKLMAAKGTLTKPKARSYNQPEKCMVAFEQVKCRLAKLNLVGTIIEHTQIAEIVRTAREVSGCLAEIAKGFLQPFYKCEVDRRTLDIICWQIAGNRTRLANSQPSLYSGKPEELSWMPGVVAEYCEGSSGPRGSYRVRILDGPAAGLDMYVAAPKGLRLMSDVLGATYKVEKERFHLSDYRDAVQLRLLVYPDPVAILQLTAHYKHTKIASLTKVDSVGLIRTTPKQKKHNAELVQLRKQPCHHGFTHACTVCQIGYRDCHRSCTPRSASTVPSNVTLLIKGNNLCQKISEEA